MTTPINSPDPSNDKQTSVNQPSTPPKTTMQNSQMQYAVISAMKDIITMNNSLTTQDIAQGQVETLIETLFDPLKSPKTLSAGINGLEANLKMVQNQAAAYQQEANKPGISTAQKQQFENLANMLNGAYNRGQTAYTSLNQEVSYANQQLGQSQKWNWNIVFGYGDYQGSISIQYMQEYNADLHLGLNDGSVLAKKLTDASKNNISTYNNELSAAGTANNMVQGTLQNLANAYMNMGQAE